MKVIQLPDAMRAFAASQQQAGRRVALVPTMGALHDGHLSLVEAARTGADCLVASVFVNPTQFGPGEDLERYPRRLDADTARLAAQGVEALFAPDASAMYAGDHSVYVNDDRLADVLCGPHRPGHFRGVLTVVAKLFNIIRPDVAVFGQKDAQQARLIQQMVRDLHYPVQVLVAPTVREPDGVAMSSRNAYLSPAERVRARCLSAALRMGEAMVEAGDTAAADILARMRSHCEAGDPPVVIDYVAAVDWETLQPVRTVTDGTLLAIALRIGTTRLIDNVIVGRSRVAARLGLL